MGFKVVGEVGKKWWWKDPARHLRGIRFLSTKLLSRHQSLSNLRSYNLSKNFLNLGTSVSIIYAITL